jgi:hypothetical protein
MANFAEVGHTRAIANAIRGIDRRARADQAPTAFRFRKVGIESPNRMSRPGFVIRNLRSWGLSGVRMSRIRSSAFPEIRNLYFFGKKMHVSEFCEMQNCEIS